MVSLERMLYRRTNGYVALTDHYFLSQFAVGMIGIFGAVYLFEFYVEWYWGLLVVVGFYVLQRVVCMLILPVVVELLNRFGYRRVMSMSLMALILRLGLMSMATRATVGLLGVAALFGGIYLAGYWLSFNGLLVEDGDVAKVGTQQGYLSMLGSLAALVSPFVAGVVVQQAGFQVMFGLAMVVLGGSLLPLFRMGHHKHSLRGYSLEKVWKQFEEHPHFTRGVFFWNVAQSVLDIMWPVYLMMMVGSYALLGSIYSGVMLASGISVMAAGKIYDSRPLRRVFPVASAMVAVLWGMRFLTTSLSGVVTADILGRLLSPLWWMKIRRFELRFGGRSNAMVYASAHELLVAFGTVVGLSTGGLLVLMSRGDFRLLMIPGIAGVLFSTWAARKK
jgi:hypothetical protein